MTPSPSRPPLAHPAVCRILLIDDHPMMRRGLSQLLELHPEFEVIGQACHGEEALAQLAPLQPDMILLDYRMPQMNGLETLKRLRERGYRGRVLIFTLSDAEEDVRDALRAGADGYLLKDMEPDELVERLQEARRGELVVSPSLAPALLRALKPATASKDLHTRLSERERGLLRQLAGGQSNKEIAQRLGVSEGTVKLYVKQLLQKLGLRTRIEAAIWALEKGLG